jgi:hypothetical protein
VGHLKTFFAQVGENLISQISKSSKSRGRPGGDMLKFRIDRYINPYRGRGVGGVGEYFAFPQKFKRSSD